jgi:LacI family transcriptional regulator
MKKHKSNKNILGSAGRAAEVPSVFIGTDMQGMTEFDPVFMRVLTEEAVRRNWQLIELELFDGCPPLGITIDGVFTRSIPDSDRVKQLRQFTNRLVRIGSAPHPDDATLPAVLPDLIAQGRLAARHFAERGFMNLGFVGRKPWSLWENLYLGVVAGAKERGISVELLSLPAFSATTKGSSSNVFSPFTGWIQTVSKPLALICTSDAFAARFCAWARSVGVKVPTELAILGNGNNPAVCERCLPRISSIDTAETQRGIAACDLMATLLAGKKQPRQATLIPPSGIVVRESTDILATIDPLVAEALHFMWRNFARNLSVDDIATHTGVHRRKLERTFRAAFGRGVNAELRRRRLEKSTELLAHTELTATEISAMTGFLSDDYFYRTFRRTFGVTPIQWRKACRK